MGVLNLSLVIGLDRKIPPAETADPLYKGGKLIPTTDVRSCLSPLQRGQAHLYLR